MNTSSASWSYGDSHMSSNFHWSDHHGNARNNSTMSKMQHQYWVTKETVLKKLGKKQDEHIVASDAELDAKLELFKSIQESCLDLQRIIDKYQERLCVLAQEENSMGRFLKESGKADKTGAGSLMISLGKTMSQAGQQRISLRSPLLRLFQEVETFRQRAIEDTDRTVQAMEKARTKYRASLSWMKDVSQALDPDAYSQLEKFKKVQGKVKANKSQFDQFKVDTLEKVDLLAAARCNMFSHALSQYHSNLLKFASGSAAAYQAIADVCSEHQHFEWNVVKELSDLTPPEQQQQPQQSEAVDSDEKLLNFDDDLEPSPIDKEVSKDKTIEDNLTEDSSSMLAATGTGYLPSQLLLSEGQSFFSDQQDKGKTSEKKPSDTEKSESSWLDLISELDPLANPDSVGQRASLEPFGDC
ncbi:islet cell autoantigen 1 [Halyomorpha halys]|uniref:islet cell autoantigen 1 n=1 Tax=Halyomorpha halys TaxID=286706 RepID=UPI0006D4DC46|nr:islet cell autoantigen 1 [Halyomorpha halys]